MLVVNCDKREEEYREHMAQLKEDWFAVPFENQGVSEKLEDIVSAANIPRLAIFNPSKTVDEAQIKDCKSIILQSAPDKAVSDIMEKLTQWTQWRVYVSNVHLLKHWIASGISTQI